MRLKYDAAERLLAGVRPSAFYPSEMAWVKVPRLVFLRAEVRPQDLIQIDSRGLNQMPVQHQYASCVSRNPRVSIICWPESTFLQHFLEVI